MKFQDVLSIGTGFLEALLFAGNIFGYFSLHFVLEKEGYFADQCNLTLNNVTKLNSNHPSICEEQEASFNLAFTLAVSCLLFFSFPLGFFFDYFGTWFFRTIATPFFSLGYLLLALSSPSTSILFYPALIFIGVGGISLLASNFQTANFSQSARGLIVTLINGLFDSSVVVFFVLKRLYDNGVEYHTIISTLTGLTAFMWLRTYLLMPKRHVHFPLKGRSLRYGWKEWVCYKSTATAQEISVSDSKEMSLETTSSDEITSQKSADQPTFKSCLKRPIFWTNVFHFSVLSFRANFLIGTLQPWLKGIAADEDEVSHLTDIVGYLLMLGVFAAPLNGIIIDFVTKKLKSSNPNKKILNLKAFMVSMLVTCTLAIILSIMIVIPSVYATFVFMLLTRGFIFGGNAAFLSIVFPIEQFGKLFGLTNFVAGFVFLLQYAITRIALSLDPKFFYINIAILVVTFTSLVHPLAIFVTIRKVKEENTVKYVEATC